MISIIPALLGLCFIGIGMLCLLAGILPKWGGGTEPTAFPLGAGFLALGLWLIFRAGALA